MLDFIKNMFGNNEPTLKELVETGAQIIDVRTPEEFANGNINLSRNIPLQELKQKLEILDKNKPIITVCESGMRSMSAQLILKQSGFEAVYNGGGWRSLQKKIHE